MAKSLISILIPFKTTAAFLPECINSIISQTHQNWEAIFIDDGSKDNSFTIVKNFAKQNPKIKLYRNKIEVLEF